MFLYTLVQVLMQTFNMIFITQITLKLTNIALLFNDGRFLFHHHDFVFHLTVGINKADLFALFLSNKPITLKNTNNSSCQF